MDLYEGGTGGGEKRRTANGMKRTINSTEAKRNEGKRGGHGSRVVQHTVVHYQEQGQYGSQVKLQQTEVRLTQTKKKKEIEGEAGSIECREREEQGRKERKKKKTFAADID